MRPADEKNSSSATDPHLFLGPLTFLLVLALLSAGIYLFFINASTPEIAVPNISGKPFEQAVADLKKRGFAVEIVRLSDRESVAVGLVIRTHPAAGSRVKSGRQIMVYVAAENAMISVPDLTGLTLLEAENRLSRAGIDVGGGLILGRMTWQTVDTSPAGTILSHDPPPTTTVKSGVAVDVVIAVSVAGDSMPNLVGKMLPDALDLLSSKGCLADTIESYFTTARAANTIMSQKPSPGTRLGPDIGIKLTVAVATSAEMTAIQETNEAKKAEKELKKAEQELQEPAVTLETSEPL